MRGAVFFDEKKKGLDQILYSLGVDDVEVGKRTIIAAMRQTNDQNIGRISYKNFNSIQKVRELQSHGQSFFEGSTPLAILLNSLLQGDQSPRFLCFVALNLGVSLAGLALLQLATAEEVCGDF